MGRPKGSKNKKKSHFQKINDKILNRIVKDVQDLFENQGGLSKRDEKIIRENYKFKTSSWNSLGQGMRSVIERMVAPMLINAHAPEIQEAIMKDLEEENGNS